MSDAGAFLGMTMRRLGRFLLRLPRGAGVVLALVWMAVLYFLSEMDGPDLDQDGDWLSFLHNLAHAPAFGLLAFWALIALPRSSGTREHAREHPRGRPREHPWWPDLTKARSLGVVLFVVAYGFIDELHQSFVPGRSPSFFDVLSDGVGAWCVVWMAWAVGAGEGRGLLRRIGMCLVICGLAAGLSTLWSLAYDDGPWLT
ncbi:MAG: VanZ family protein [Planctomycetota bacterium]|nr:VanZ family protein [Planctomycetota bacterium]MDP6837642.1 VanZ family protein [Planctomycetota bacterium]